MWFLCAKYGEKYLPLAFYKTLEFAILGVQEYCKQPYKHLVLFQTYKNPLAVHMVDGKVLIG